MSEFIQIAGNPVPWRPTPSTELEAVLHYYDLPLTGVLRQGSETFLFRCVNPEFGSDMWVYVRLTDAERDALLAADEDHVWELMESLLISRPAAIAMTTMGDEAAPGVETEPHIGIAWTYHGPRPATEVELIQRALGVLVQALGLRIEDAPPAMRFMMEKAG